MPVNARGKSSSNEYSKYSSVLFAMITLKSFRSQNSAITCLHTAQGAQKSPSPCFKPSWFPTTAIALKSFWPSETALKKAVLSAQFVGVKAAFSILHPVYISPLEQSNAAPTLNLE